MRIQNYTKLKTELLREIIRHCLPPGVSGFDIAFKNSAWGYKGLAYTEGCSYHSRSMRARGKPGKHRGLVTIGVCKRRTGVRWTKPYRFSDRGAYLGGVVYSDIEAIVLLVAHELRHLWQKRVPRGRRVWGSRGQYSERDADAYGIRKVREWRRLP